MYIPFKMMTLQCRPVSSFFRSYIYTKTRGLQYTIIRHCMVLYILYNIHIIIISSLRIITICETCLYVSHRMLHNYWKGKKNTKYLKRIISLFGLKFLFIFKKYFFKTPSEKLSMQLHKCIGTSIFLSELSNIELEID